MLSPSTFLAFDTSTDQMSLALSDGTRVWQRSGPGGAQSSTTLIPALMGLLAEAGLTLDSLDAIVFGRGPGSFTGLRTACAVAQGLAFGAKQGVGIPVLPVDTLMALAEEARFARHGELSASSQPLRITALLDARMDEMYVQSYQFASGRCQPVADCRLVRPEALALDPSVSLYAGNVFEVYAARLPQGLQALACAPAWPTAAALLRLAPALVAAGHCVEAAQALPLYVRDKVAQTTDERAQIKRDAVQALADADAATPRSSTS